MNLKLLHVIPKMSLYGPIKEHSDHNKSHEETGKFLVQTIWKEQRVKVASCHSMEELTLIDQVLKMRTNSKVLFS